MMKEFFFIGKGERRGIMVLVALIIVVSLAGYLYLYLKGRQPIPEEEVQRQAELMKEYEEFAATVRRTSQEKRDMWQKPQGTKHDGRGQSLSPIPFDPNTADSLTFVRMGLPQWMARNILRYRSRGGRFRQPDDFRKIYGLTEEQYRTLLPYMTLADTCKKTHDTLLIRKESSGTIAQTKYPEGIVLELNAADTTELKRIPGIGSGIARMIAGYRQRLGGFYRIEQLGEIRLNYALLKPWFRIDTTKIQRINVNKSNADWLRHHPYIDFYQAKVLVEHRKRHGDLNSLKPLALYEEFTEEDLERLSHYICFR